MSCIKGVEIYAKNLKMQTANICSSIGYTDMFLFFAVIIRAANPLRICFQMMPLCIPISFMFVKNIQNSSLIREHKCVTNGY